MPMNWEGEGRLNTLIPVLFDSESDGVVNHRTAVVGAWGHARTADTHRQHLAFDASRHFYLHFA